MCKFEINDDDLVRLLKDRIDDADADTLSYMAQEILGMTHPKESVEYNVEREMYVMDIPVPEELGFVADWKKNYNII